MVTAEKHEIGKHCDLNEHNTDFGECGHGMRSVLSSQYLEGMGGTSGRAQV